MPTSNNTLNLLSLFSGIGGLDLGLERAGMRTVGQVELEPVCRQVLARHWPDVPQHDDVRTAAEWWTAQERPHVDVIAGGFPCQPFSTAGLRTGTGDERWGWPWMAGVVRVVRPRYVVVENVAALLDDRDAFGWVLSDLAELGFDAEWGVLSACSVGAPHVRRRLFVVAYPAGEHGLLRELGLYQGQPTQLPGSDTRPGLWADPLNGPIEAARRGDRMANGLAGRMVAAGGNAVVPAVAEHIGRLLVAHHTERAEVAA